MSPSRSNARTERPFLSHRIRDSPLDLQWEDLPNARACRIVVYRPGEIESLASDPEKRAEVIAWGIEKLKLIEQVTVTPGQRRAGRDSHLYTLPRSASNTATSSGSRIFLTC